MTYLVFADEATAVVNEGIISANMGCDIVGRNAQTGELEPTKQRTTCWAIPRQRLDGKWVFAKPALAHMGGVEEYTEEEYGKAWFPDPEM